MKKGWDIGEGRRGLKRKTLNKSSPHSKISFTFMMEAFLLCFIYLWTEMFYRTYSNGIFKNSFIGSELAKRRNRAERIRRTSITLALRQSSTSRSRYGFNESITPSLGVWSATKYPTYRDRRNEYRWLLERIRWWGSFWNINFILYNITLLAA